MPTKAKSATKKAPRPTTPPVYLAMAAPHTLVQAQLSLALPLPPDVNGLLRRGNTSSSSASSSSSAATDERSRSSSSSLQSVAPTGGAGSAPQKKAKSSTNKKLVGGTKAVVATKSTSPSKPAPPRKQAPTAPVLSDKKLVKLAKLQAKEQQTLNMPDAPASPRKALASRQVANQLAEQRDVELAALLGLAGYRPQPRIPTALVDDKYYALNAVSERPVVSM